MKRIVKAVVIGLLLFLGVFVWAKFEDVSYVARAAIEQVRLMAARRPIDDMLRSSDLDPHLRERLELVLRIRRFAAESLHLPDSGSYTDYVELGRANVAWSVFAAPSLSIEPITWCFPFAGCVIYRGFFDRQEAIHFAVGLMARDNDVHVSRVSAYSTLGWFNDPVLSSFVEWSEPDLAGLIFHELAHQRLYEPGDSDFNEGFAVTVQREGVRRWLTATSRQEELLDVERAWASADDQDRILLRARQELSEVFASDADTSEKRKRKSAILSEAQRLVHGPESTRAKTPRRSAVPSEMESINNAYLVAVAGYYRFVPHFVELLHRENGDLDAFYGAVQEAARMPVDARHRYLEDLVEPAGSETVSGDR